MKNKLNRKTQALASGLTGEYQKLFTLLLENIHDDNYTRHECNFFLRKSIHELLKHQQKNSDVETLTHHNAKKWAVEENKKYKKWHERYQIKMKECDQITYAGFFAMVAYSITLITVTAFTKGALSTWFWILIPAVITVILLITKILFARRQKLPFVYTYGDILMFALISVICYFSNVYFIIFLWVYEVSYMLYLQFHIVEEDC